MRGAEARTQPAVAGRRAATTSACAPFFTMAMMKKAAGRQAARLLLSHQLRLQHILLGGCTAAWRGATLWLRDSSARLITRAKLQRPDLPKAAHL